MDNLCRAILMIWIIGMVPSALLWFCLFYRYRHHDPREPNVYWVWGTWEDLFPFSLAWPFIAAEFLSRGVPRVVSWIDKKVYGLSTRKTVVVETEKARTELGAKYRQRAEMAAKHRRLEEEIALLEAKAYPLR